MADAVALYSVVCFNIHTALEVTQKLKIFLASSWLNKNTAKHTMERLIAAGHSITYDWTVHPATEDTYVLARQSVADLSGVNDADVFILLWPGRLGSSAELGAALAFGKQVIIVGNVPVLDFIYANYPGVIIVDTVQKAIEVVASMFHRRRDDE